MPREARKPETRKINFNGNVWQISAHVGECYEGELDLTITSMHLNGHDVKPNRCNIETAKRLFQKDLL